MPYRSLWLLVGFSLSLAASYQVAVRTPSPSPNDVVLPSVVQLVAVGPADKEHTRACSATGFLINEEGYLITNAHVVEDAKRCLQNAPGAKILAKLTISDARTAQTVPCAVVGMDIPNDLALLKTERPLFRSPSDKPPYATLDVRTVAVGAAVRVSGYPASAWQPVTQDGHVDWRGRMRLEDADINAPASDALRVDIHLRPGNSGSPVYCPNGGVIGVVDKRDSLRPAYSVAVAIHYAIELADRFGARWHGTD